MIFIMKNANIRGKRRKKEGKEEIVTVLWGKNMIVEKKGVKISIILIIYTPALRTCSFCKSFLKFSC